MTLSPTQIMDRLAPLYGEPEQRPHRDPLAELIQTVLSQNTSDTNSGRAFVLLMRDYKSWDDMRMARVEDIERVIQPGGLAPQKAPRIHAILQVVKERAPDWRLDFLETEPLEAAKEWLRSLPGVGPKTAACVLLFALGRPALPVDTHVERVSKRLGLIPWNLSADKAHDSLEALVPPQSYYRFHMLLIKHGRRTCVARNPACGRCPVEPWCPSSRLRGGTDGPNQAPGSQASRSSSASSITSSSSASI